MQTTLYFILMLSAIILIHELGHFLVARLFNVYIHEFAIGMGPKILTWKGKETLYSIRLLPIGGMVVMAGDEDDESEVVVETDRLVNKLPGWKRIVIMVAGPVMNFILAWILLVGIFANIGYIHEAPPAIVNGVLEGSVAEVAGFEFGDEIIKINASDGKFVEPSNSQELIQFTSSYADDEMVYTIKRGEETIDFTVTPVFDEASGRYLVGVIFPEATKVEITFVDALKLGTEELVSAAQSTVTVLGDIITGRALDTLSGPLGIYAMTEQQVSYGFMSFLSLVALLSLSVGFMNLLPIPIFDGGRILLVLAEMVIGRRLPQKLEVGLMFGGLVLVLLLTILVTANDLTRLLG